MSFTTVVFDILTQSQVIYWKPLAAVAIVVWQLPLPQMLDSEDIHIILEVLRVKGVVVALNYLPEFILGADSAVPQSFFGVQICRLLIAALKS